MANRRKNKGKTMKEIALIAVRDGRISKEHAQEYFKIGEDNYSEITPSKPPPKEGKFIMSAEHYAGEELLPMSKRWFINSRDLVIEIKKALHTCQ